MDNWTIWHDPSLAIFEGHNAFLPYAYLPLEVAPTAETNSVWAAIRANDVRYVYIRTGTRRRFMASVDPLIVRYREQQLRVERTVLRRANLQWRRDDCNLYRIRSAA
jgi:hypothetical protein